MAYVCLKNTARGCLQDSTKEEASTTMTRKQKAYRCPLFFGLVAAMCMSSGLHTWGAANTGDAGEESVLTQYQDYRTRLGRIENIGDISENGFVIVEDQTFPIEIAGFEEGSVSVVPALDEIYSRLALFLVDADGAVLYKTDQLETNSRILGQMEQPNRGIAAVSYQDLNGDGALDIVLITTCDGGDHGETSYKVGDVLFQADGELSFYRDYRISDKLNRFGMNKSVDSIVAYVRDGYSTEFMYTAATLDELLSHGLRIIDEQCYTRLFGKLGRLQVVPGTYKIADYEIFMIYLVNEQDYIVSSLQPMGDHYNLYALRGITCRDIDGDGLKDMVVLARYSDDENGTMVIESDYAVYYQRTGGFSADEDIKDYYTCGEDDTMEALVAKVREYWGWTVEDD